MSFLSQVGLILIVVVIFNIIIFVHELGHFLAARWRGLQVDRFQIWFGKPIWKKEINGVQYGLGWLPFGGFVALPQMAPMESIEGGNRDEKPLPKVKPLDKIIVAFAGPLFSLLLAFAAALLVWQVGKPKDAITNTVIGVVEKDSPAEKAGLLPGDKILEVDDHPVKWFQGDLASVSERIMLTKNDQVKFKIERNGEIITLSSEFKIDDTAIWQRRALPKVGIRSSWPAVIQSLSEGKSSSPAQRAGLKPGDEIVAVNGENIYSPSRITQILKENGEKEIALKIKRDGQLISKSLTPLVPEDEYYQDPKNKRPMMGFLFDVSQRYDSQKVYPNPFAQIKDSLMQMWVTITSVVSPKSKVGVDQLAGPVGIAKMKFQLLQMEDGWYRLLFLLVLFNVNLAVLNMLPFPVLDGGHIVMAFSEMLSGKPMNTRFLEFVQTGFALLLMCFILFITTKDVGSFFGGESEGVKPPKELTWPAAPAAQVE